MSRLDLLPISLLAISSNADNVAVGMAYGVRGIRVPFKSNLLIALVTSAGTGASMLLGKWVGHTMQPRWARLLGGVIILAIGVSVVLRSLCTGRKRKMPQLQSQSGGLSPHRFFKQLNFVLANPLTIDQDQSGQIDIMECWLLALALVLNNLTNGLAAGMIGLSVTVTTIGVSVCSLITLWTGITAGHRYGRRWFGDFAGVASGLLLVVIGTYELAI